MYVDDEIEEDIARQLSDLEEWFVTYASDHFTGESLDPAPLLLPYSSQIFPKLVIQTANKNTHFARLHF